MNLKSLPLRVIVGLLLVALFLAAAFWPTPPALTLDGVRLHPTPIERELIRMNEGL